MFPNFICLTVGVARVVDPFGAVALNATVNHKPIGDVKIKRMVGLQGVVRVTSECFLPSDDLSFVFNDHLTFGNVNQCEDALAVNA